MGALVMATDSTSGLNMSGLTKCLHVFVLAGSALPFDALSSRLNLLGHLYDEPEVPLLLFPRSYAKSACVVSEKTYNVLVFHRSVGPQFADYVARLTDRKIRRKHGGQKLPRQREGFRDGEAVNMTEGKS